MNKVEKIIIFECY